MCYKYYPSPEHRLWIQAYRMMYPYILEFRGSSVARDLHLVLERIMLNAFLQKQYSSRQTWFPCFMSLML